MPQPQNPFDGILSAASKVVGGIDVDAVKKGVATAGQAIGDKAGEIKDAAAAAKDDLSDKLTELDRMLGESITAYNDAYTLMSDKGLSLYIERVRASDLIGMVEDLVSSIANRPASFDADFAAMDACRKEFDDTCAFADRELQAAREASAGAGAGLAAGASVAFMAPTAAMWVATTFGTASTGAAISTLSGAAASNAALAWLGGGALAAGGGGVAAGNALLALAGPVGWGIAGATLLSSIVVFSAKRHKLNKEKSEEIESVKRNTAAVRELDAQIAAILRQTVACRDGLSADYRACLRCYGADYTQLDGATRARLGALVNDARATAKLFERTVGQAGDARDGLSA